MCCPSRLLSLIAWILVFATKVKISWKMEYFISLNETLQTNSFRFGVVRPNVTITHKFHKRYTSTWWKLILNLTSTLCLRSECASIWIWFKSVDTVRYRPIMKSQDGCTLKKKEDTLKNSLLNYNAAAICRFVLQELCQSVHLSLFKYQTLLNGSRKANTKMF